MTGDFEKFALYAGEGAGRVGAVQPAAAIIENMMTEAVAAIRDLSDRIQ
jgi:nitronate monooxygenase